VFDRRALVWQKSPCLTEEPVFDRRALVWQKSPCLTEEPVFDSRARVWQKSPCLTAEPLFDRRSLVWQKSLCLTEEPLFDRRARVWQQSPCSPTLPEFPYVGLAPGLKNCGYAILWYVDVGYPTSHTLRHIHYVTSQMAAVNGPKTWNVTGRGCCFVTQRSQLIPIRSSLYWDGSIDYCLNNQPDALTIQTLLLQNSTCFGQPLCPWSGVLYCTFGTGKFRAGFWWALRSRVRMELVPSWLCLEMVINKLHETYQCRMYSRGLLMMGREDGRNM
jgi:hypothetical protein